MALLFHFWKPTLDFVVLCDDAEGVLCLLQENALNPHVGWTLGPPHPHNAPMVICLHHLLVKHLQICLPKTKKINVFFVGAWPTF